PYTTLFRSCPLTDLSNHAIFSLGIASLIKKNQKRKQMKKIQLLAVLLLASASYQCKEAKKDAQDAVDETIEIVGEIKEEVTAKTIKFAMEPKSDSNVKGDVSFTEEGDEVKMIAV